MEPQIRTLVDIAGSKADLHGRADMMLERARWAGQIFQRYDRPATMRSPVPPTPMRANMPTGRWRRPASAWPRTRS